MRFLALTRLFGAVAAVAAVAMVAAVAVAAALVMFAAPAEAADAADAAPYVHAPALSVSASGPCKGTSLTVDGTGFVPRSSVRLTLHPRAVSPGSAVASLGSALASAAGGFTRTVTLPAVVGTYQLIAVGPPTSTNPNTAEVTLHIRDCSGPVPITGYTGNPRGGTGYALPAGLAALAFLALGGGLLWWHRNRRHTA